MQMFHLQFLFHERGDDIPDAAVMDDVAAMSVRRENAQFGSFDRRSDEAQRAQSSSNHSVAIADAAFGRQWRHQGCCR